MKYKIVIEQTAHENFPFSSYAYDLEGKLVANKSGATVEDSRNRLMEELNRMKKIVEFKPLIEEVEI